jgi:hypothetical protein
MQDFADTYIWPERRVTEEDVQRMREAEGIDAGDYGQGDEDPDDDGGLIMLGGALIVTVVAVLGAIFWPY